LILLVGSFTCKTVSQTLAETLNPAQSINQQRQRIESLTPRQSTLLYKLHVTFEPSEHHKSRVEQSVLQSVYGHLKSTVLGTCH